MKKLKEIIKNFFPTLKKYASYLMKVGYKELFVNTVILFCLIVLSAFVYVPIAVFQDFIKDTLQLFAGFGETFDTIFYWVFNLISAVCAILVFMWLFNMRFESVQNKEQNKETGKEEKKSSKEEKEDNFDLPKAKKK